MQKVPPGKVMANGMNMFLIQCWRMKDAKSCGIFFISTDNVIEPRRPDIVCIEKIAKRCLFTELA